MGWNEKTGRDEWGYESVKDQQYRVEQYEKAGHQQGGFSNPQRATISKIGLIIGMILGGALGGYVYLSSQNIVATVLTFLAATVVLSKILTSFGRNFITIAVIGFILYYFFS